MNKIFYLVIPFLVLFSASFGQEPGKSASKPVLPKYTGWINDFNKIFSRQELQILDSLLTDYEAKTTNEIVVVTLDSTMANRESFDSYNLKLANYWGIGKKEKNNGILITIATPIRMIRINTGIGVENLVTDQESKSIIDSLIAPKFRNGLYFEGTVEAIRALIRELE